MFIVGIGKQIRCERLMHRFCERNKRQQQEDVENLPTIPFEVEETLLATPPNQHHRTLKRFGLSSERGRL